jgi:hypothetical protein
MALVLLVQLIAARALLLALVRRARSTFLARRGNQHHVGLLWRSATERGRAIQLRHFNLLLHAALIGVRQQTAAPTARNFSGTAVGELRGHYDRLNHVARISLRRYRTRRVLHHHRTRHDVRHGREGVADRCHHVRTRRPVRNKSWLLRHVAADRCHAVDRCHHVRPHSPRSRRDDTLRRLTKVLQRAGRVLQLRLDGHEGVLTAQIVLACLY